MTIELAAVPLAAVAGVLGVLSPCVWPLVPVVTSAAAAGGRRGPLYLALGLSLSFAIAGTFLTLALVSLGLDPELFRYVAAAMLVAAGVVLLSRRLNDRAAVVLSRMTGRLRLGAPTSPSASPRAQFGVGALLGVVWLPCVGPSLGAAIALASLGQSLGMAFAVMLAYGIGTAVVLLAAGALSARVLARWRASTVATGARGKAVLGWSLVILGVLVLSGVDKTLEAMAVDVVPEWVYEL